MVAILSTAATSRHLGGGGALDVSLWRVIGSLLACLAIATFAILLVRQRSGHAGVGRPFARFDRRPARIVVVETRRISPHADVCLIKHDGREYLLVVQQGGTRVLGDRMTAEEEGRSCG